jgi:NitT/TauT family transport system permease protein
MSLIGAVIGELVGARDGLGHIIENAATNLQTTTIFSAVLLLTVMGVVLSEAVALLEARALFWHRSQRKQSV